MMKKENVSVRKCCSPVSAHLNQMYCVDNINTKDMYMGAYRSYFMNQYTFHLTAIWF